MVADGSKMPLQDDDAQPVLDFMNPITWWGVYKRISRERPDLVILPWWTSFWTLQFWTIASLTKRFSPAKILFICHNIVDHEPHLFSKLCTQAVLSKGDYLYVHSENDARLAQQLLPAARITHAFHPLYDCFQEGTLAKTEARSRLGLEGDTILFFGFIRPYKGISDLLKAMPLILKQRKITLLVVGEFWDGQKGFDQQVNELGITDAVRVVDKYVANEDVGLYFSAADLVVLPYRTASGSGIVQIAYALDKPVVATCVGSLREVVENGRTGYLVDPGDTRALADAVIRFFQEGKEAEFVANIRKAKRNFSWEQIVSLIEQSTTNGNSIIRQEQSSWTPQ